MRKRGLKTNIDGKNFDSEYVFCNLCGWGDTIAIEGIIIGNDIYDFCRRHKESEIKKFLENEEKTKTL